MSEQDVRDLKLKDIAPPAEHEDEADKKPDLGKDMTVEDHRKAFAQAREKATDRVPNVDIELVEVRGDGKSGEKPAPAPLKLDFGPNAKKVEPAKPDAPGAAKPDMPGTSKPDVQGPPKPESKGQQPKSDAPAASKPEAPAASKPEAPAASRPPLKLDFGPNAKPKQDAPKSDAVAPVVPKADAPAPGAPKPIAPKFDAPAWPPTGVLPLLKLNPEVPKTEAPKTDAPALPPSNVLPPLRFNEVPKTVPPVAPKPDVPVAPKPDVPVAPKPDVPIAPKPDVPVAPKPDVPVAPQPSGPKADVPVVPAVKPEVPVARPEGKLEAVKPPEKTPLTKDELARVEKLQSTLISQARLYATYDPSKPFAADAQKRQADDAQLQNELKAEKEARVYGPATQRAFDAYAQKMDIRVLVALQEIDKMKLGFPAGCPIELPLNENRRPINPELFKLLGAAKEIALDLKTADKTKIPTVKQLGTMDAAYDWVQTCTRIINSERNAFMVKTLGETIEKKKLPEGWKKKDTDDPDTWRQSAESMIDLAARLRNYVEAMHAIHKLPTYNDFPMVLPPGTKITVEEGDTKRVLSAEELRDPGCASILKKGRISLIELGLPKDLRQEDPANADRIAVLRNWLQVEGERVDKVVDRLVDAKKNPEQIIMYGDAEVKHGKGLFDRDNRFMGLVRPDHVLKEGHKLEDVNLVGYDYNVTLVTDAFIKSQPEGDRARLEAHKGEYMVTQTIQAEHLPPWAYLNARAAFIGSKTVGAPMLVDEKFVKPDEFIPVKNGGKVEIVKGSNLEYFKQSQRGWYYGEKVLVGTMDVAMAVSGTIELRAIARGARLSTVGAEEALKLGFRETAWEGTKGTLRVTAAAAGLFNNAGGRETAIGEAAETFRAIYFPLDIGSGLLKGGYSWARSGINALRGVESAEVMNAGQKVHKIIHGLEDARSIKALEQLSQSTKGAEGVTKLLEAGKGAESVVEAEKAAQAADALKVTLEGAKSAEAIEQAALAGQLAERLRAVADASKAGETLLATTRLAEANRAATVLQESIEATKLANTFKGMPWASGVHTGTHWAFKVTEIGFFPLVTPMAWESFQRIGKPKPRDSAADAQWLIGDGRFPAAAAKTSFDMGDKKVRAAAEGLLLSYADTLADGRPEPSKAAVSEIMKNTAKFLDPAAKAEERDAFKRQLLANLTFSESQIRALEQAYPGGSSATFRISEQQIKNLMDPEKLKSEPKAVRELAQKYLNERDKEVVAASRIALLYLNRKADGSMDDQLGAATIAVPEHQREVTSTSSGPGGGQRTRLETIPARTFNINIGTAENVESLKSDLAHSEAGNRSLVVADFLSRIGDPSRPGYGAITHQQFAAVLQNILNNPNATREQKMRALTDGQSARMAAVVDGLGIVEKLKSDQGLTGRFHGTNYKAMLSTLEQSAKNDKDADVRAMSAALLYGLRENDPARKNHLLSAFNSEWQRLGREPNAFANRMREFLTAEMEMKLPPNAPVQADALRISKLNAVEAMMQLTPPDDAAGQKKINEALVDCLSSTKAAVAVRTLDLLIPARLAQLDKDNPALANKVRTESMKLLMLPRNYPEAVMLSQLLGRMEPLLRNGDVEIKKVLVGRMQDFLSRKSGEWLVPDGVLRAAAIDTLSAMGQGDNDSLDAIRSHVTALPKIKAGDRELNAGEDDPEVRAAAVKALQKLKDRHLRAIVDDLIDTELDAATAAGLRDVSFGGKRIDPGSREWDAIKERAMVDIREAKLEGYPHLDAFKPDEWLKKEFDLLDPEEFRKRCHSAAAGAYSQAWFLLPTTKAEQAKAEEEKKVAPLVEDRKKQWEKLRDLAVTGQGKEADKAKMALYYILSSNAMGKPGFNIQVDGNILNKKLENPDWQGLCARALIDCAESGADGRRLTKYILQQRLVRTDNYQTAGAVNADLLEAWQKLGAPSKGGPAVEREELARVCAAALAAEVTKKPDQQTDYYQQLLIDALKEYKHRMSFPFLDGVAKTGHFPVVRAQAAGVIDDFEHSVNLMWDDTRAPAVPIGDAERVTRLRAALADNKNSEQTVQEMFNVYKGYKLSNPADAGLPHLQLALNDSNERVRMAASRILLNSGLPVSHPAKAKAIESLRDLQTKGSHARYKSDAEALLKAAGIN